MKKTKISLSKPDSSMITFLTFSSILPLLLLKDMYFSQKNLLQQNVADYFTEEYMLIKSFTIGINSGFTNIFKIHHPICYKCVCRSRWITALHTAMMVKSFASERVAILIPSYLYIFSICLIHMQLSNTFLKNSFLSVLSTIVFLFAGGLEFFGLLIHDYPPETDFVHHRRNYETEWLHPILEYLVPYRPSQLATGLFLTLISILTQVGNKPHRKRDLILCGIVSGLILPAQYQVFAASVLFTTIYLFYLPISKDDNDGKKNNIFDIVFYFVPLGIISIIPLLQFFPRSSNFRLLSQDKVSTPLIKRGIFFSPFVYWIENLGVFAVITLTLGLFVIGKKLQQLYYPSLVVFFLLNFFKLQPVARQNIFVFIPCWLSIASIVFMSTLSWISQKPKSEESKGIALAWCTFFFVAAIMSSLIGLQMCRNNVFEISLEERDAADWITQHTSTKDVFISDIQKPYTPVPYLSGRRIFASRVDILEQFDKTVDWKNVEFSKLLSNLSDKSIAKKVKYALFGRSTNLNENSGWKLEYHNSRYKIYSRIMD
ncbi:hypothetical protein TVAG_379580 [Trichomonas vaginalis G3]|uniref:Mannosyltransferase n=1 Tax=Trichomonas vaginalis (strain ATCC PRA-98 / G3) TaxID=412133 RepID=A2E7I3_TRIV3|nr:hypothetical protein TVAGG3_0339670 [Trichomonas vaginalis G3]EAY11376.1 hypothetical protein TVAG_379580 [Trichomonas vaginalis G3]KAI5530541.1 hypothetical protein TVAGG3_0339670 [Trichomonas vaginalis G3]|eukprot:XP_001323599.1 hypothetical protein [Trichomonas vaginalis G3]